MEMKKIIKDLAKRKEEKNLANKNGNLVNKKNLVNVQRNTTEAPPLRGHVVVEHIYFAK